MTDFWMTDAWMVPAWVVLFSTVMTAAFWNPPEDRINFWCAAAGTMAAALYAKAFCADGSWGYAILSPAVAGLAAVFARAFANSQDAEDTPLLAVVACILCSGILPVCIATGMPFAWRALPLLLLGWPLFFLAGAYTGEALIELVSPWVNEER